MDWRYRYRHFRWAAALFALGLACLAMDARGQLLMTGVGKGPGAASCTFPTLSGLLGRWNGSNVIGSPITQATDLSGNGNHLVNQGTVTLGSAYNGHPTFTFVTANDAALKKTSFPIGTGDSASFYAVGFFTGSTPANAGIVTYGVTGNDFNTAGNELFSANNGSTPGVNFVTTTPTSGTDVTTAGAVHHRWGTTLLQGNTGPANNINMYLDGAVSSTRTSGFPNWVNSGTFALGNRFIAGVVGGASAAFDGSLVEVAVGNAAWSSTDIANIDAYYTCQWGT